MAKVAWFVKGSPMPIEANCCSELAQIQAESIGWIPLEVRAYLHVGTDEPVIQVIIFIH